MEDDVELISRRPPTLCRAAAALSNQFRGLVWATYGRQWVSEREVNASLWYYTNFRNSHPSHGCGGWQIVRHARGWVYGGSAQ